jgi:phosphoribosylamine---glycine ligase
MKVLLVGSGSRESALAWKIRQSPLLDKDGLFANPGNAYTSNLATNLFVDSSSKNWVGKLVAAARDLGIDYVVVGPEEPLIVHRFVERFDEVGIPVFGPGPAAALWTEGSKSRATKLVQAALVPHPYSLIFSQSSQARDALQKNFFPCAVKYDGLAAGKGVWGCETLQKAQDALNLCEEKWPGEPVVVQEFLEGIELSVFGFYDGKTLSSLIGACDFKKRFSGDQGPNTGGMASYAPWEYWNCKLEQRIRNTIFLPTLDALGRRGIVYRGVLYAGLMLTRGGPQVLEFNCRFGDPEAQAILPLLENDLLEVMLACTEGKLHEIEVKWRQDQVCDVVVMVDRNYPGDTQHQGEPVTGLGEEEPGTLVFPYALTRNEFQNGGSRVVLNGGGRRVAVVGMGRDFAEGLLVANCRMHSVRFPGADWIEPTQRVLPEEWLDAYPA